MSDYTEVEGILWTISMEIIHLHLTMKMIRRVEYDDDNEAKASKDNE